MYMYMYEETNDNRRKAGPWRPPARRKEDILASAKSATGGPKARRFKLNLGHRQRGACDDDSARALASGKMGRPPSRRWVFGLVNKAWGWLFSWHHHRYRSRPPLCRGRRYFRRHIGTLCADCPCRLGRLSLGSDLAQANVFTMVEKSPGSPFAKRRR